MITVNELHIGTRVRLGSVDDEGVPEEVGTVMFLASAEEEAERNHPGEGREAIVIVDSLFREPNDDGLREVWFDEEMLARTDVVWEVN